LRKRAPDDLRGTPDFKAFFLGLGVEDYLYKIIKEGLDALRENMEAGDKIEKGRWPKIYAERYGITNLFKLDLDRNYRLTYTIIAENMKKVSCVIEVMDHKTYNRRFGYR